ncbi:hypothetical protein [Taibaiella soli]|uniref:Uncharacterized protein n=1 Tax=Taibaiella soli TaxID=1649169 RepID=A0A2W2BU56_9BACT|nr:hypothetical protein [Taibaiella soli]PZF71353.1 hypothetical protein DN068_18850 [Taibaiella soli]
MKNPVPFIAGSLLASILLVGVMFYTDQDPAAPFWNQAKDFVGLAFILTGFWFCVSYGAAHLFAFLRKQAS